MNKYNKVIGIRNLQPVNPFFELEKVVLKDKYLDGPCVNENVTDIYTNKWYESTFHNKFVESYYLAFINHGNAVFSPSDLLFIFNTSFAKFVKENPKVTEKFVADSENSCESPKEDKKLLHVEFSDMNPNKLDVINEMLDKIKEDMYNTKILELLENNLSCATKLEKTACSVAIMESVEKFYRFQWTSRCGFNHIKLIGDKEDWILLKSKVTGLQNLFSDNREWNNYCNNFLRILNEFIKCFGDSYNVQFFERMIDGAYDFGFYGDRGTTCSGWILDLFYKFKSYYIVYEVPNMVASIDAVTDGSRSTLVAEFVGTSITYDDSIYNNLDPSKTYLLSSHVEDNKQNSDSESDSESDSKSDSDSDDNSDNNSDNGSDSKEPEEEENEYNSFRFNSIQRVKNNMSDVIHDYRPVLACYFK